MNKKPTYEFVSQQVTLNDGTVYWRPLVRRKQHGLVARLFENPWERITIVYGKCITMDLPFDPLLTAEESDAHIERYKKELKDKMSANIQSEVFSEIQEF